MVEDTKTGKFFILGNILFDEILTISFIFQNRIHSLLNPARIHVIPSSHFEGD